MSDEELGRRAVACKGWRWMPGMLSQDTGLRLDEMTDEWEGKVPDFSDPATLGCLLALVREALDDSRIHCRARANKFRVYSGVTPIGEWANSEGAALVAALEVAE